MDKVLSQLSDSQRLALLTPPAGRVRMVLDTDTFNEIDDQFALAYALLSGEKLDVEAIYAAPFSNERSDGPRDGMEKSYEEIVRVLARLGRSAEGFVFRGSTRWFGDRDSEPAEYDEAKLHGALPPSGKDSVESDAAMDLIERARGDGGTLYVVAIGAITNVASAVLLAPDIVDRIVVVWLAGHPSTWHSTDEFNLRQDMAASRTILDCGVPLVRVPCVNVAEHLTTTVPEMDRFVRGRGPLGDYLYSIFEGFRKDQYARSKVIWDVAPVAWLLNANWIPSVIVHTPILTEALTWSFDPRRALMREAIGADRDAVFGDLFRKIEGHSISHSF